LSRPSPWSGDGAGARPPCVAAAPLRKCGADEVGREAVVVAEEDEE
jgi:hypothetical protein